MKLSKRRKRNHEDRIGVVEESHDNIYSIKFILQSLGYPVRSFAAEGSYLQDLVEYRPRLLIVDMMISNRGGYRAIREIGQTALAAVPILAITADAMEGNVDEVLETGGKDYLSKPYSVADLQKKLVKWLGESESQLSE